MNISLIISTYNRPEALRICLESIKIQTVMPYEVIIGDDGSTEHTKKTILELEKNFPISIRHIWHEDKGFRLSKMRNKAVAATKGDYIIEIDGDVFLHPRFVEDHIKFAKEGYYLKGGRVNLNPQKTLEIIKNKKPSFSFSGIESKPENGVRIPMLAQILSERYRRHKSPGLGCNMSFWKKDFLAINGYDEFFEGWGGEDIEFATRLQSYGCKKRYLKFAGIIYHLWHEDKFMQNREDNFKYAFEKMNSRSLVCEKGVSQYL